MYLKHQAIKDHLLKMNLDLVFIEHDHSYWYLGEHCRSITNIISSYRSEKEKERWQDPKFLKWIDGYTQYGKEIHKLTQFLDSTPLEFQRKKLMAWRVDERVDETINNDMFKYSKLKEKYFLDYELLAMEMPICSLELKICGTIDRLWFDNQNKKLILVDIKTGDPKREHWVQQLFYKELIKRELGIIVDDILILSIKQNKVVNFNELKENKILEATTKFNAIWSDLKKEVKPIDNNWYAEAL